MGTSAVQGELWGRRATDWADIQESTARPVYEAVMKALQVGKGVRVLDVGCGAGMFCQMAAMRGAEVHGFDAAASLLAIAKARVPSAQFQAGEMEELPFAAESFDVVTGFNSFQYAASPLAALREAKRVLKKSGTLVVMVWGRQEDCQAAAYLKAVGSMLPPPPPGAPGPFALSQDGALEKLLGEAGFTSRSIEDVDTPWHYADLRSALRGMLSAGPAIRAMQHSGEERVRDVLAAAIAPFRTPSGTYALRNKARYALAAVP